MYKVLVFLIMAGFVFTGCANSKLKVKGVDVYTFKKETGFIPY